MEGLGRLRHQNCLVRYWAIIWALTYELIHHHAIAQKKSFTIWSHTQILKSWSQERPVFTPSDHPMTEIMLQGLNIGSELEMYNH